MMSLGLSSTPSATLWRSKHGGRCRIGAAVADPSARLAPWTTQRLYSSRKVGARCGNGVGAFFSNPAEDPVIKEALKEPVAFMGGIFAGILRLDLNEEPLKEWVTRTMEASGTTEEELNIEGSKEAEEAPQEIVIE